MLTRLIVVVIAALLSLHAFRTAVVLWPPARRPVSLETLWPDHPLVIADRIMTEVGSNAARGRPPGEMTRDRLGQLARKAPLAVEPFLIEGALAQMNGRDELAERLFLEARHRDPRSPAARYFLGSRYLATDRIPDGLEEISVFTRLVSGSEAQFVPALAAYARSPGAVPQLRRFFRSSRQTEEAVLAHLAADASNADLIFALASSPAPGAATVAPAWQEALVSKLVEVGQYDKAYAIWARLAAAQSSRTLFNPTFRQVSAPPPFNWRFDAGKAGVAEPSENGLKVVYYGRDDAVLISQLLLLPAGTYQLAALVQGESKIAGLAWSLSCQPGKRTIATLPIARPGVAKSRLTVPAGGCAAQLLELRGTSSEGAQLVEVTILRLVIAKGGGR